MKKYLNYWLFVATLSLSGMSVAADNVIVRYLPTDDAELQRAAKKLRSDNSIQDTILLINEQFHFPQPLIITFGAEEGPLYDPNINDIFIPYTFLTEVEQRFNAVNYAIDEQGKAEPAELNQAVMDVLIHTLFHELAHALIAVHELPIVGKEEDAADNLAAVLAIEYFVNGAEIAISAADLFYLEGDNIDEFEDADFWDEHSLDLQRYYATLCHVYGSDNEQYAELLTEVGFSVERGERCIEDYARMTNNWLTLLAPYMNQGSRAMLSE